MYAKDIEVYFEISIRTVYRDLLALDGAGLGHGLVKGHMPAACVPSTDNY